MTIIRVACIEKIKDGGKKGNAEDADLADKKG